MSRRLAAILAADVVGYSAMMAEDEASTLEALRRLRRELFHPAVAGHRGQVVKAMGDGWLVEFGSASDAVNCAVQIQSELERNEAIRLRMGIHLGDITHEEEDVYGDGVNVAARLEAIAEPGALVVSDAVYGTLDGTLAPSFDNGGELELKNIPRAVRVWVRGALPKVHRGETSAVESPRAGFPVKLAILPVEASDERQELAELAAALTNDLFNYLDNGRWLSAVVMETPSRGTFVLSTTLRARGDRLRLDTTLRHRGGEIIWSRRSDGELADSFDWQDAVGIETAVGAHAAIDEAERARLTSTSDRDKTAADWLQSAMMEPIPEEETLKAAITAIERCVALDPDWGLPYAFAAHCCALAFNAALEVPLAELVNKSDYWIEAARGRVNGDPSAELYLAYAEYRRRPVLEPFRTRIEAVLRRYPYHETALYLAGLAFSTGGDPATAADCARKMLVSVASASDSIRANTLLGSSCIHLGLDQEALSVLRRAMNVAPDNPVILRCFASAAALTGHLDEAQSAVRRLLELLPSTAISSLMSGDRFLDTPGMRRYLDGLRSAGVPE